MPYGFGTWDANGVDNNTGLVRIMSVGSVSVGRDQTSGSWSFYVPAGYTLDYLFQPTEGGQTNVRRRINITGSSASLSAATGDYGSNTEPGLSGNILFYVR